MWQLEFGTEISDFVSTLTAAEREELDTDLCNHSLNAFNVGNLPNHRYFNGHWRHVCGNFFVTLKFDHDKKLATPTMARCLNNPLQGDENITKVFE